MYCYIIWKVNKEVQHVNNVREIIMLRNERKYSLNAIYKCLF